MSRNFDLEIARHILAAQIASDMAKYDYDNKHYYYHQKDLHIKEAIIKICKSKSTSYRFSVANGDITPYLVYFTIKIPGEKRLQVSFHSFSASLERFYKSSKTQKTYWDKRSSRRAALTVGDYYNIVNNCCRLVDCYKSEWQEAVEYLS